MKLALQLVAEVLTPSLEELQAQTRRLLLLIDTMVTGECERLRDRTARLPFHAAHGAAVHTLGRHAVAGASPAAGRMEYLIVRHGGAGADVRLSTELRDRRRGQAGAGRVSQFSNYDTNCAGVNGDFAGGARPGSGGIAEGARGEESPAMTRGNGDFSPNRENRR